MLVEGRTDEAMQQLQSFFALWKQVQDAMVTCARAIEADFDTLDLAETNPPPPFSEAIRKLLNDLKDAMINHDYAVVGDLLQYEFTEPLQDWLSLLNHLQRTRREVKHEERRQNSGDQKSEVRMEFKM